MSGRVGGCDALPRLSIGDLSLSGRSMCRSACLSAFAVLGLAPSWQPARLRSFSLEGVRSRVGELGLWVALMRLIGLCAPPARIARSSRLECSHAFVFASARCRMPGVGRAHARGSGSIPGCGCGVRPSSRATWLILPVVICLSQRLSHACLSISDLYCETANGSLNQLWFI